MSGWTKQKVFNVVINFYDFIPQNLFLVHCQECYEKIGRKAQSWQPILYTSSSAFPVSLNSTPSLFTTRLVPCACRWWNMRWRDMSSGQLNLRRRKIISKVNRNMIFLKEHGLGIHRLYACLFPLHLTIFLFFHQLQIMVRHCSCSNNVTFLFLSFSSR